MVCKYCGAKLSAKEKSCPKCGKSIQRTVLEGGNGFWDIAEFKTTVRADPPPAAQVKRIEITKEVPARKSVVVCAVLCALAAISLIVSVLASISVSRSIKQLEARLDTQIISETSSAIPEKTMVFEKTVEPAPLSTTDSVGEEAAAAAVSTVKKG